MRHATSAIVEVGKMRDWRTVSPKEAHARLIAMGRSDRLDLVQSMLARLRKHGSAAAYREYMNGRMRKHRSTKRGRTASVRSSAKSHAADPRYCLKYRFGQMAYRDRQAGFEIKRKSHEFAEWASSHSRCELSGIVGLVTLPVGDGKGGGQWNGLSYDRLDRTKAHLHGSPKDPWNLRPTLNLVNRMLRTWTLEQLRPHLTDFARWVLRGKPDMSDPKNAARLQAWRSTHPHRGDLAYMVIRNRANCANPSMRKQAIARGRVPMDEADRKHLRTVGRFLVEATIKSGVSKGCRLSAEPKHPCRPSIDKETGKLYRHSELQVVPFWYNAAKCDWTDELVERVVVALCVHQKWIRKPKVEVLRRLGLAA